MSRWRLLPTRSSDIADALRVIGSHRSIEHGALREGRNNSSQSCRLSRGRKDTAVQGHVHTKSIRYSRGLLTLAPLRPVVFHLAPQV